MASTIEILGSKGGISVGLSSPAWLQVIEVYINPVLSFAILIVTLIAFSFLAINRYYQWRENWNKRKKR